MGHSVYLSVKKVARELISEASFVTAVGACVLFMGPVPMDSFIRFVAFDLRENFIELTGLTLTVHGQVAPRLCFDTLNLAGET